MTARVVVADVVAGEISSADLRARAHTIADGAVVTFDGIVRDHDGGRSVVSLDYEAHPSAASTIASVAERVAERHPEVRVAVLHRVGALALGDVALAVAVASPHRREAFEACSDLVDTVKAEVPIWKRQVYDDGSDEWTGSL